MKRDMIDIWLKKYDFLRRLDIAMTPKGREWLHRRQVKLFGWCANSIWLGKTTKQISRTRKRVEKEFNLLNTKPII